MHFLLVFLTALFCGGLVEGVEKAKSFDCSGNRIELAIVLDASSSIGPENFNLTKKFLHNIVDGFKIGEDYTRIGLITFADDPEILFTLKKYKNLEDIKNAIQEAKFLNGITALGAAIKLAGTGILHESRSGIQKVILVMTDGRNNKFPPSTKMAQLQKDVGTMIIAVGIGNETNPDELKGIASNGLYFQLNGFSELPTLISIIKSHLCKVIIRNIINVCETEGDISFVIDSKEQAGNLFNKQIELIKYVSNLLNISDNSQRVAIVVDNEGVLVPLDKFHSRLDFVQYLSRGQFQQGPKIESGIEESGKILTADRKKVPKLVVIIRTKNSKNVEFDRTAALSLRRQGSNIVTVALGQDVDINHLKTLSTTRETISLKELKFQNSHISELGENICQNLKEVYTECIGKKLDIMLVLDCSSSIGPANWIKQLDFISRIVMMLDIGRNDTRLGCVFFNSEAFLGFPIDKYDTKKDLIAAIRDLPFSEGGTAIGDALHLARTQINATSRKDVPTVLILITDGQSNMGLAPESEALQIRKQGVHIICVGISGDISKEQLMRISSNNRYYPVKDYKSLEFMSVESLTKESCLAVNNLPQIACDDFAKAGTQDLCNKKLLICLYFLLLLISRTFR